MENKWKTGKDQPPRKEQLGENVNGEVHFVVNQRKREPEPYNPQSDGEEMYNEGPVQNADGRDFIVREGEEDEEELDDEIPRRSPLHDSDEVGGTSKEEEEDKELESDLYMLH